MAVDLHGEFMGFGVRSRARSRILLPSPHARLNLLPPSILVPGRQNGKEAAWLGFRAAMHVCRNTRKDFLIIDVNAVGKGST